MAADGFSVMLALRINGAPVAQWIERWTSNPKVGGSNPSGRTSFYPLVDSLLHQDSEFRVDIY